jgi:serine/threonine protein kinase
VNQTSNPVLPRPEIPDFDLLRLIGQGGFGQVWLGRNQTTGQLRAVKVIPLRQSVGNHAAIREISSLTRLEANTRCRHDNLLTIHHIGKTADHLFYVMSPADDIAGSPASDSSEYRPATLLACLQNGPLPPDVCLDYAKQLLAGLASLHAAGMVHRDVKPANCLFVGGQLKLADFGLLTESHPLVSRVGTQRYMPPNGQMDQRADVYAAGLVLYEMLTGLSVDHFPSLGQPLQTVAQSPVFGSLVRTMLHACELSPEARYSDARKMLADLQMPLKRPRRSRMYWLAACAALLMATFMADWFFRPKSVEINFITEPQEAFVFLNDVRLLDSSGVPYTTPCTIAGLDPQLCNVSFEDENHVRWNAGEYDLAKTRQIVSQFDRTP